MLYTLIFLISYMISDISHASNAVDGNDNPAYDGQSCTHTLDDSTAWWVVDLGNSYKITGVSLVNRDCCGTYQCQWLNV